MFLRVPLNRRREPIRALTFDFNVAIVLLATIPPNRDRGNRAYEPKSRHALKVDVAHLLNAPPYMKTAGIKYRLGSVPLEARMPAEVVDVAVQHVEALSIEMPQYMHEPDSTPPRFIAPIPTREEREEVS